MCVRPLLGSLPQSLRAAQLFFHGKPFGLVVCLLLCRQSVGFALLGRLSRGFLLVQEGLQPAFGYGYLVLCLQRIHA